MKVTENVHKIISIANTVAAGTGTIVMPIHLLYGCAAVGDCLAAKYLAEEGITVETMSGVKLVHKPDMTIPSVIVEAEKVSNEMGSEAVVSEAVLFVLSTVCLQTVEVLEKFKDGLTKVIAKKILTGAGINPNNLTDISPKKAKDMGAFTPFGFKTAETIEDGAPKDNSTLPPDILRLGADLTAKARAGKIDAIIGRDEETSRIIEVLCRKTKNNPVLIGEAGVGKSAIIEGLAKRIVEGNVPRDLEGKIVFSLDIGMLMAGTKYRGELERKLEALFAFVSQRQNIILFIDEIHGVVTATGKEGELGIAEMLKPKLARGELQTIGATTTEEYRKHIEKDAALERRFAPIMVEPPTAEQAIEILAGLRPSYERFHGVEIRQDALVAAVTLSDRYITDRHLPDKAIDVLDEACSKAKIKAQLDAATARKEEADKAVITSDNIAEAVSLWTKIPVSKLTEGEKHGLINLEAELKKAIVGQDHAIEYIARAVRRGRAGIADPNRPIGTFMFLGRTGIGKTEVCKVLAKHLFLSDKALVKMDMSEYQEAHSVSNLTGAPPGYVGYDDASQLCERVRRNPYCVVLFDEIEKAHPDIYNVLLQILDEGRLTDNKGRTTSFRNALIIMTSNIGVENLTRTGKIGFAGEDDVASREEEVMMQGLRKRFKPEFINRIDNVVVFNALTKEAVAKIAEIQVKKLSEKIEKMGLKLNTTKAVITYLVDKGYSHEYGARPLRRVIQSEIEDKIAEQMLSEQAHKQVYVDAADGKLSFRFV